MAATRRLWFVVPSQYTNKFDSGYPELSLSEEKEASGRKALNGNLDDPMVTDGVLDEPVFLTLDGIGEFDHIYFEAGNWVDSDFDNCRVEVASGYASNAPIDSVVGLASNSSTVVAFGAGSVLVLMDGAVDEDEVRLRFTSTGTPLEHLSIPNIWIGKGYQMDAMYSLGATKGHRFLQKTYEKSASGVPLTQQRTGANYGTTLRNWALTFEWIDEDQLQDLKNIYTQTQGFRPFKMVLKNDGSTLSEPEAYSVTFSDDLQITEVEDGYYTVSVTLKEHK